MSSKTALKYRNVDKNHFSSGVKSKPTDSRLVIRFIQGNNLLASDRETGKSDPLCFAWCGHADDSPSWEEADEDSGILHTMVCPTTIDPIWEEELVFPLDFSDIDQLASYRCLILCRDEDINPDGSTSYDDLGMIEVPFSEILSKGKTLSSAILLAGTFPLTMTKNMRSVDGTLKLNFALTIAESDMASINEQLAQKGISVNPKTIVSQLQSHLVELNPPADLNSSLKKRKSTSRPSSATSPLRRVPSSGDSVSGDSRSVRSSTERKSINKPASITSTVAPMVKKRPTTAPNANKRYSNYVSDSEGDELGMDALLERGENLSNIAEDENEEQLEEFNVISKGKQQQMLQKNKKEKTKKIVVSDTEEEAAMGLVEDDNDLLLGPVGGGDEGFFEDMISDGLNAVGGGLMSMGKDMLGAVKDTIKQGDKSDFGRALIKNADKLSKTVGSIKQEKAVHQLSKTVAGFSKPLQGELPNQLRSFQEDQINDKINDALAGGVKNLLTSDKKAKRPVNSFSGNVNKKEAATALGVATAAALAHSGSRKSFAAKNGKPTVEDDEAAEDDDDFLMMEGPMRGDESENPYGDDDEPNMGTLVPPQQTKKDGGFKKQAMMMQAAARMKKGALAKKQTQESAAAHELESLLLPSGPLGGDNAENEGEEEDVVIAAPAPPVASNKKIALALTSSSMSKQKKILAALKKAAEAKKAATLALQAQLQEAVAEARKEEAKAAAAPAINDADGLLGALTAGDEAMFDIDATDGGVSLQEAAAKRRKKINRLKKALEAKKAETVTAQAQLSQAIAVVQAQAEDSATNDVNVLVGGPVGGDNAEFESEVEEEAVMAPPAPAVAVNPAVAAKKIKMALTSSSVSKQQKILAALKKAAEAKRAATLALQAQLEKAVAEDMTENATGAVAVAAASNDADGLLGALTAGDEAMFDIDATDGGVSLQEAAAKRKKRIAKLKKALEAKKAETVAAQTQLTQAIAVVQAQAEARSEEAADSDVLLGGPVGGDNAEFESEVEEAVAAAPPAVAAAANAQKIKMALVSSSMSKQKQILAALKKAAQAKRAAALAAQSQLAEEVAVAQVEAATEGVTSSSAPSNDADGLLGALTAGDEAMFDIDATDGGMSLQAAATKAAKRRKRIAAKKKAAEAKKAEAAVAEAQLKQAIAIVQAQAEARNETAVGDDTDVLLGGPVGGDNAEFESEVEEAFVPAPPAPAVAAKKISMALASSSLTKQKQILAALKKAAQAKRAAALAAQSQLAEEVAVAQVEAATEAAASASNDADGLLGALTAGDEAMFDIDATDGGMSLQAAATKAAKRRKRIAAKKKAAEAKKAEAAVAEAQLKQAIAIVQANVEAAGAADTDVLLGGPVGGDNAEFESEVDENPLLSMSAPPAPAVSTKKISMALAASSAIKQRQILAALKRAAEAKRVAALAAQAQLAEAAAVIEAEVTVSSSGIAANDESGLLGALTAGDEASMFDVVSEAAGGMPLQAAAAKKRRRFAALKKAAAMKKAEAAAAQAQLAEAIAVVQAQAEDGGALAALNVGASSDLDVLFGGPLAGDNAEFDADLDESAMLRSSAPVRKSLKSVASTTLKQKRIIAALRRAAEEKRVAALAAQNALAGAVAAVDAQAEVVSDPAASVSVLSSGPLAGDFAVDDVSESVSSVTAAPPAPGKIAMHMIASNAMKQKQLLAKLKKAVAEKKAAAAAAEAQLAQAAAVVEATSDAASSLDDLGLGALTGGDNAMLDELELNSPGNKLSFQKAAASSMKQKKALAALRKAVQAKKNAALAAQTQLAEAVAVVQAQAEVQVEVAASAAQSDILSDTEVLFGGPVGGDNAEFDEEVLMGTKPAVVPTAKRSLKSVASSTLKQKKLIAALRKAAEEKRVAALAAQNALAGAVAAVEAQAESAVLAVSEDEGVNVLLGGPLGGDMNIDDAEGASLVATPSAPAVGKIAMHMIASNAVKQKKILAALRKAAAEKKAAAAAVEAVLVEAAAAAGVSESAALSFNEEIPVLLDGPSGGDNATADDLEDAAAVEQFLSPVEQLLSPRKVTLQMTAASALKKKQLLVALRKAAAAKKAAALAAQTQLAEAVAVVQAQAEAAELNNSINVPGLDDLLAGGPTGGDMAFDSDFDGVQSSRMNMAAIASAASKQRKLLNALRAAAKERHSPVLSVTDAKAMVELVDTLLQEPDRTPPVKMVAPSMASAALQTMRQRRVVDALKRGSAKAKAARADSLEDLLGGGPAMGDFAVDDEDVRASTAAVPVGVSLQAVANAALRRKRVIDAMRRAVQARRSATLSSTDAKEFVDLVESLLQPPTTGDAAMDVDQLNAEDAQQIQLQQQQSAAKAAKANAVMKKLIAKKLKRNAAAEAEIRRTMQAQPEITAEGFSDSEFMPPRMVPSPPRGMRNVASSTLKQKRVLDAMKRSYEDKQHRVSAAEEAVEEAEDQLAVLLGGPMIGDNAVDTSRVMRKAMTSMKQKKIIEALRRGAAGASVAQSQEAVDEAVGGAATGSATSVVRALKELAQQRDVMEKNMVQLTKITQQGLVSLSDRIAQMEEGEVKNLPGASMEEFLLLDEPGTGDAALDDGNDDEDEDTRPVVSSAKGRRALAKTTSQIKSGSSAAAAAAEKKKNATTGGMNKSGSKGKLSLKDMIRANKAKVKHEPYAAFEPEIQLMYRGGDGRIASNRVASPTREQQQQQQQQQQVNASSERNAPNYGYPQDAYQGSGDVRSSYNNNALSNSREMANAQVDVRSSWDRNSGASSINKDFCEVLDRGSLDDVARMMESTGPRPELLAAATRNRLYDAIATLLFQNKHTERCLIWVLALVRGSENLLDSMVNHSKKDLVEALERVSAEPSKQGLLASLLKSQIYKQI